MDENVIVRLEEEGIVTATFRRLNQEKKKRLYQAALKAFSEDVFDRVSIDAIVKSAAVSKGSLFQYFVNKENLLKFVCEIVIDDYRQFWKQYFAAEHAVMTKDRIRDFFRAQSDFQSSAKWQHDFCMKMNYENSNELTEYFLERITQLRNQYIYDIIRRGITTGEIRRDIDIDYITFVLAQVSDGIWRNHRSKLQGAEKKWDDEDVIDNAVRLLFDGICG